MLPFRRRAKQSGVVSLTVVLLLAACARGGCAWSQPRSSAGGQAADSWCGASGPTHWSQPLQVAGYTVLGKPDVYSCSVLSPPTVSNSAVTQLSLHVGPSASKGAQGAQLHQALLLDCDAGLWQLAGIQDTEAACLASTSVLRAACNQWLVSIPSGDQTTAQSCAPQQTAFATPGSLSGRVLVMQAHWRLPQELTNEAVAVPSLHLALGSSAAAEATDGSAAAAQAPALLGTFVGSGIYPPSLLSQNLQAFELPVPAASPAAGSQDSSAVATASLACGKRCTYVPLGRLSPQPVNVVGYSFSTFDRATEVSFEIQRGKAGRSAGHVHVSSVPGQGVLALQEPFKLYPGDIVRWGCSYNMSNIAPGSSIKGGYSSSPDAQQEQCTVMLHYWPRVDAMRGCSAALDDDVLLGENMCSAEAEDLMRITGPEALSFPMRRMYVEHSFPAARWMGGWKATHLILQMAVVWSTLWGFQTLLSQCKALGPIHRRFISLHAGQQRNVSLYLTHLLLDTLVLGYVFQAMIELWFGLTETVAEVRCGCWGFTYLVACYLLELTWRRSIDTMLAIHHIGTITIIMLYAGEFTSNTYRVANNIIVLAAFALMEQPTYVALLLKRMLPSGNIHVVRAARVGYISWFVLKGASVLLAASMFVEDWHIMPLALRINFIITWIVAALVQGWSGFIQRGIYRHILRAHKKSTWEHRQEHLKRQAAAALSLQALSCPSSSSEEMEGEATPPSSNSSDAGLSDPLLVCRRMVTVTGASTDSGDAGLFDSIGASMGVVDNAQEALGQQAALGCDQEGGDGVCTAAAGSDKRWPSGRWQGADGLSRCNSRLSTSSSLADAAQPEGGSPSSQLAQQQQRS